MTRSNTSKPDTTDSAGGFDPDASGGVTTVSSAEAHQNPMPFAEDSADSPYGSARTAHPTTVAPSSWTGSPYEPLPSEPAEYRSTEYPLTDYSAQATGYTDSTPTYIPPPGDAELPTVAPVAAKQTRSRARAGFLTAVLGTMLIAGGLYLLGEFGFRIFDVMLHGSGRPQPWDIVWTSVGAALMFAAVLLNGWSPWATLPAGVALTAAGVWSIAWYDGADRVASAIDRVFARPEMVVWGVTGWLLILGVVLLGASFAAVIARAAGRRRGMPGSRSVR